MKNQPGKSSKRVPTVQQAMAEVGKELGKLRAMKTALKSIDVERRFPGGRIRIAVGEISISREKTKGGTRG